MEYVIPANLESCPGFAGETIRETVYEASTMEYLKTHANWGLVSRMAFIPKKYTRVNPDFICLGLYA